MKEYIEKQIRPHYRMVAVDCETTGVNTEKDEVLQISIVDEDGKTLINTYCAPEKVRSWVEAERVNRCDMKEKDQKKSERLLIAIIACVAIFFGIFFAPEITCAETSPDLLSKSFSITEDRYAGSGSGRYPKVLSVSAALTRNGNLEINITKETHGDCVTDNEHSVDGDTVGMGLFQTYINGTKVDYRYFDCVTANKQPTSINYSIDLGKRNWNTVYAIKIVISYRYKTMMNDTCYRATCESSFMFIDTDAPTGSLSGVINGGRTTNDVIFRWDESNATAKLDGKEYTNGIAITDSGRHSIILRDEAGNENRYAFLIDKSRPHIRNLDDIKNSFGLGSVTDLSAGQNGSKTVALGTGFPGVEFSFADEWSGLHVSVTEMPFTYDHNTGNRITGTSRTYDAGNTVRFSTSGQYTVSVKDDLENELKLTFTLGTTISFDVNQFIKQGERYILPNDAETRIISFSNPNKLTDIAIEIDDERQGGSTLSLSQFKACLVAKNDREKSARIVVKSERNGITTIYFDAYVGYDFLGADIHNIGTIGFSGGSGSYLGTAKPGFAIEYGALDTELSESATIYKKYYEYDDRDDLTVIGEENVEYNGEILDRNGYYVLRISDGVRVTEYTFKILDSFRSVNEYVLKNEYFIAPEYNQVKLPLSFGAFRIVTNENIDSNYVGTYSAEKSYLFNAVGNSAYDFAFAAEYSVCVQKTSTGYLYRARNQGIQVAYNSFEQLRTKINEVIKGYIRYKSMRVGDSQVIDYENQIIMDEALKFNGRYENVVPMTVAGNVYDRIMLINKDFVFCTNAGDDETSGQAVIEITNVETGAIYTARNGESLGTYTELNGLYCIRECYPGSALEAVYYVYIDNVAPTANITAVKGDGSSINQTITAADTIVLQVTEFTLLNVIDLTDNFCMAYVSGYGFSDALPIRNGEAANVVISAALGHRGEYTIEIYDRSKNKFSFVVYIMGVAPEATFTKSGSGDSEHVILNISLSDRYCNVMGLHIYRNQTESNLGELTIDSDGTTISFAVLSYVFRQGGRYRIEILDNFARTTIIELRYFKDMPYINVDGLNKARRVNRDVTVTLPLNCLYEITAENHSQFTCDVMTDTSAGVMIIVIRPRNEYNELVEIDDKITVKAWYAADPDSYNDLAYVLDTIAPTVALTDEGGTELANALSRLPVKIDYDADVKEIEITRNGKYFSYISGQTIRLDGEYVAKATDTAGNSTILEWVIDCTVDYVLNFEDGKKYVSAIENGVTVVRGFHITPNEQLVVSATKDGYAFEYLITEKILTSGIYVLSLTDNAGNNETMKLRVLASIEGIALRSADGSLLQHNALTRSPAYLEWSDLSYIKSISYKVNSATHYDYLKGSILTAAGSYTFTFTDVVENTIEIRFVIDNAVDIVLTFDKSYPLDLKDGAPHTLTTRFKISHGEKNIQMQINIDSMEPEYTLGTWIAGNGTYIIYARDEAGNDFHSYVTVIGETQPDIDVRTVSGQVVENKAILNESAIVSWAESDYISYVNANFGRVENGETVRSDGKYTLLIVDLLGRENTRVFTIKTQIDYAIEYRGQVDIEEDGAEIVMTRGFKISSADELTITATLDGEPTRVKTYLMYSTPGDFSIEIADDAGNVDRLRIRVIATAFLPEITDYNNEKIANNGITNGKFRLILTEYIAKVSVNGEPYDSVYGWTGKEGKNVIEIMDVLGATATLFVTIDSTVQYRVTYGKSYDKGSHMLADKFMITPDGEEIEIHIYKIAAESYEELEYGAKYYSESGFYSIDIRDRQGNTEMFALEVDNRIPDIVLSDASGAEISNNVVNCGVNIGWTEDLNIAEVRVNGSTAANGSVIEAAGDYEIVIVNLLGNSAVRKLTIKHIVDYEIEYRVGSYEYTDDGEPWILTAGFSIDGNAIVAISAIKDGQAIVLDIGKFHMLAGAYHIEIIDDAGNVALLNVNVSDRAIEAGVIIDGETVFGDQTTNTGFCVAENRFVRSVAVLGSAYAQDDITDEGKYRIEYTDVLGRKAYQNVRIDKTVAIEWEYKHMKTDTDGKTFYLAKRLLLTAAEPLTVTVEMDGEEIQYAIGEGLAENGIYAIAAADAAGNAVSVRILVDNEPPIISVSDPDDQNRMLVSINDATDLTITVRLNGRIEEVSTTEFVLDRHGRYVITAADELGNSVEKVVSTDRAVDVTYNFFSGQSINFKPYFSIGEIVNYALEFNGAVVEYKLNGDLPEKGIYTIRFVDERKNTLELTFDYLGASRKMPATELKLPSEKSINYKVFIDEQPSDISAVDGALRLNKDGNYEIIFTASDGREIKIIAEVITIAPTINLGGKFKSQTDLRAYGDVSLSSTGNYVVYFNGELIDTPSVVDKVGKYKIVATDSVGNVKEIEFEIYYRMNGWSVLLIVLAGITMVLMVFLLLKRKGIIKIIKSNQRRSKQ